MKKLYFIRHGLSEANKQGVWSGHTDTPLSDEGRAQATEAGKAAKSQGLHFDIIVSSPLGRALETAQLVAKEVGYPIEKIVTNDLLKERNYGSLEGAPYEPKLLDKNTDHERDKELLVRAREALDWIESLRADNVVIVAHGSIGRALRQHVHEDFPMSRYEKLANAQLYEWV